MLVVGAGIVGLAHAAAAHDLGLDVVVIDRDHRAVGESVRNFGHCCVTAQSGDLLDLARVARQRWLDLSRRAGFWAVASGGLVAARSPEELAVLEEYAAVRTAGAEDSTGPASVPARGTHARPGAGAGPGPDVVRSHEVALLTAAETRDRLGGATTSVIGGLALHADLRVDPREVVGRLAAWLEADGVRFLWNTTSLGTEGGMTTTSRGMIRAERTVTCVGPDLDRLLPQIADDAGLERCVLQMTLLADPGLRIGPAVLSGTSLLHYAAFADLATLTPLRARLAERRPDLLAIEANVMATQRPDGTILAGDTHTYAPTPSPFLDEGATDLVLAEIADLLGLGAPRVLQRWRGVHAQGPDPYLLVDRGDGHLVCAVTDTVGMTIAFGLAARTFPPPRAA